MSSLVTNCCVELFAIYKEVQSMFETGRLSVPEDVTLLFQDDNFGTIRRLPTAEESKRKGGAGVSIPFSSTQDRLLTECRFTTIFNMSEIHVATSGSTQTRW
jgi:hypothetical protein